MRGLPRRESPATTVADRPSLHLEAVGSDADWGTTKPSHSSFPRASTISPTASTAPLSTPGRRRIARLRTAPCPEIGSWPSRKITAVTRTRSPTTALA